MKSGWSTYGKAVGPFHKANINLHHFACSSVEQSYLNPTKSCSGVEQSSTQITFTGVRVAESYIDLSKIGYGVAQSSTQITFTGVSVKQSYLDLFVNDSVVDQSSLSLWWGSRRGYQFWRKVLG